MANCALVVREFWLEQPAQEGEIRGHKECRGGEADLAGRARCRVDRRVEKVEILSVARTSSEDNQRSIGDCMQLDMPGRLKSSRPSSIEVQILYNVFDPLYNLIVL